LAVLSGLFWYFWARKPICSQNCKAQIFIVKKGESLAEIAQKLENQKLVRSSVFFQLEATRLGIIRKMQAGNFRLNPEMTPSEIAQELTRGTFDYWITIIEGLRREEIATILAEKLEGEESRFSKQEFLQKTISLEGKLFPDTYLIPKNATASEVVSMLTLNFEKKTAGLFLKEEDLILASLVEREAKNKPDRFIVAGILKKRLNASWPLQVDATVQYAKASKECRVQNTKCQWWPQKLTKDDLKLDSPYNTYLYQGLPPTPICNPSLSSMEAVKNSAETPYWYYLSGENGKMYYAQTLKEHQENIKEYLR